jgi:biotin synthase
MLKAIALFRWILPTKNIFICAGRQHLGDLQSMIFIAGASGVMVGDFLTTKNRSVSDDLKMFRDLGLDFDGPLSASSTELRLRTEPAEVAGSELHAATAAL